MLIKYFLIVYLFRPTLVHTIKAYNKRQEVIWRIECNLGVINDQDCPVDGSWTTWSPWSECRGSCDDMGSHRRTRECINPPPSNDGAPCSGIDEQMETCYLTNCTLEDYRKLAAGDTSRNESFHQLEAVPALMDQCLQTECSFDMIVLALSNDNTWQLNAEGLWNALNCVKFNLGCAVVGEWGIWGPWSVCGARCGQGISWRLRRCDTPPPSDARFFCTGSPLQSEDCEGDQCAIDNFDTKQIVKGTWSEWGPWSTCSEKCGVGVRRRKRICNEYHLVFMSGVWGSHCRGQHDELEVCVISQCRLDGGWSGWSIWGACSQTCGSGRRSRSRSCTRPVPNRAGNPCLGPKIEIESCYLIPCEYYSHLVAIFNGDSTLEYNFTNKKSTLFHFYIRFMALSPHGILVRRGLANNPSVRLSIHKWHICLDASGTSKVCSIQRICSAVILDPEVWHSAMITVTSIAATLRIDDTRVPIKGTFPCDPELSDDKMNILIGDRFHGEIQELILNFIPLNIHLEREHIIKRSDFIPTSVSNVAYEKSKITEAFLILDSDQYIRIPCFNSQNEWRLELTVKPKRESGSILFISNDKYDNWFHIALQNKRLKIKLISKNIHSETASSVEHSSSEWLEITLYNAKETNVIEALINADERLHLVFGEEILRQRRKQHTPDLTLSNLNTSETITFIRKVKTTDDSHEISQEKKNIFQCGDEFYVGGVPPEIKKYFTTEDFSPFLGIIASISINNVLQDLHTLNLERFKDTKLQISSRTASLSGSYHETAWGHSNRLNLTCLHARTKKSPHAAQWLFLDTGIDEALKDKTLRSVDDGRVLRLVASANNDLRGFYTCRARTNKKIRNIVTYGVLGKIHYKLAGPNAITGIAVFTTLTLAVGTLFWLIFEGINDLRNGYGFFRDLHLSPAEEAEAVCHYIDDNIEIIGSKKLANMAKAKARRRARQLSRSNFAAQEPQGLLQFGKFHEDEASFSEPDHLPAIPPLKSSTTDFSRATYRLDPKNISPLSHDSNFVSPKAKLTSATSLDITSPRCLCAHLLLSKKQKGYKDSDTSKKNKPSSRIKSNLVRRGRLNLLTIKSSSCVNLSPVQKIIYRFKKLKNYDS